MLENLPDNGGAGVSVNGAAEAFGLADMVLPFFTAQ